MSALVARAFLYLLRTECELVQPAQVDRDACRDPSDLPVLGTLLAANADCLVTGDTDLLALGEFRGASNPPPSATAGPHPGIGSAALIPVAWSEPKARGCPLRGRSQRRGRRRGSGKGERHPRRREPVPFSAAPARNSGRAPAVTSALPARGLGRYNDLYDEAGHRHSGRDGCGTGEVQ
jgi:hypothetical protein